MNLAELLNLKYPNIDFLKDVILYEDFETKEIKIREWNLPEPKPTKAQVKEWMSEYNLAYRQKQAVEQRKYPAIAEQLDMQYKDLINGTTLWKDTITAIKAAHPKPEV